MSVNPAIVKVSANSTVVFITEFGNYRTTIGMETNRSAVIREARTNGAWGFRVDAQNYRLTFFHGDAILGVEFPEEGN